MLAVHIRLKSTDASGAYSIEVQPGDYALRLQGSNGPTVNAPASYYLRAAGAVSFTLTEDRVMDMTLPVNRVTIHVQDPAGNPVPNVQVTTGGALTGTGLAGYSVVGSSSYPSSSNRFTDASGNVVFWLFSTIPEPGQATYTFTQRRRLYPTYSRRCYNARNPQRQSVRSTG